MPKLFRLSQEEFDEVPISMKPLKTAVYKAYAATAAFVRAVFRVPLWTGGMNKNRNGGMQSSLVSSGGGLNRSASDSKRAKRFAVRVVEFQECQQ